MRWSRKGVVIRLLIYVPIIGYLGYQAMQKWNEEQAAQVEVVETPAAADDLDAKLEPYKRIIEMPDGSKQEIVELTEEQAEEILGKPVPKSPSERKADSDPHK